MVDEWAKIDWANADKLVEKLRADQAEEEMQQKKRLFKMFGFDYDNPGYLDVEQLKKGHKLCLLALDRLDGLKPPA